MAEVTTGVNDQGMNQLIATLSQDITRVNTLLKQVEMLVNESSSYFKNQGGEAFRSQFAQTSAYFPIVVENLESYKEDFKRLLQNYQDYTQGKN